MFRQPTSERSRMSAKGVERASRLKSAAYKYPMTTIGIDYSITSPAITVFDGSHYNFISIFDVDVKNWLESKKFKIHREIQDFADVIPFSRQTDKSTYQTEQRSKLLNAEQLATLTTHTIRYVVVDYDVRIALEGFSYASKGMASLDLVFYQSVLRLRLMEDFGADNLFVFSPTEAKKLAGKGNYSKEQMISAFADNVLGDDILAAHPFHQYVVKNGLKGKPIDDIVDSYFLLKCLD